LKRQKRTRTAEVRKDIFARLLWQDDLKAFKSSCHNNFAIIVFIRWSFFHPLGKLFLNLYGVMKVLVEGLGRGRINRFLPVADHYEVRTIRSIPTGAAGYQNRF